MNIQNDFEEIKDEIIATRRKIHQNPELGFEEFETAKTICRFLDKYGIEYESGIAKTGICAHIGKIRNKKTILLRADMDALAFDEESGVEFSSVNKGVMHACGHDVHIANALAACYILKKHEDCLSGSVKVVFQPAEEADGGALPMIEAGVLENENVDVCLGIHVNPIYPTGEFYFKKGPLMASPDEFSVTFVGKSAHGAEPQNGINPIEPASEFVLGIHKKLEEKIDFSQNVFTVCVLNSGSSYNVIPDTATISGTFRSFENSSRKNCEEIIRKYAKELCDKYKTSYTDKYTYYFPPLVNDDELCEKVMEFTSETFGPESIRMFEHPLMTGEDFAYFAERRPSVMVWAGCGDKDHPCVLHSSKFYADENVIEKAAILYAGFAIDYLK